MHTKCCNNLKDTKQLVYSEEESVCPLCKTPCNHFLEVFRKCNFFKDLSSQSQPRTLEDFIDSLANKLEHPDSYFLKKTDAAFSLQHLANRKANSLGMFGNHAWIVNNINNQIRQQIGLDPCSENNMRDSIAHLITYICKVVEVTGFPVFMKEYAQPYSNLMKTLMLKVVQDMMSPIDGEEFHKDVKVHRRRMLARLKGIFREASIAKKDVDNICLNSLGSLVILVLTEGLPDPGLE